MQKKLPKHLWKPGQSGNPGGKKPIPPEIKAFRQTTYNDFIAKLQEFGFKSVEEIQEYARRTDITMFESIFSNMLLAAKGHDADALKAKQMLFDRLWGKVPDQLKLDQNNTTAPQIIISLPDNGRDKENVIDVK